MTSSMALAELNRASATLGAWTVKVLNATTDEYHYYYIGAQRNAVKFECLLLDTNDPKVDCTAVWKMKQGNRKEADQANT